MCLYKSVYELTIPFHDLDPMNVVWHGNYIKYMEQARCDMFEKLKYNYYSMVKDDYAYPIAKMNTKFIKPIGYSDTVSIETELISIEPSMNIKYKMFNKNTAEKVFEATTMQIGIKVSTKESIYEAPKRLKEILGVIDEN